MSLAVDVAAEGVRVPVSRSRVAASTPSASITTAVSALCGTGPG